MDRKSNSQKKKVNHVKARRDQEETRSGYGNKKLEGPDRPST